MCTALAKFVLGHSLSEAKSSDVWWLLRVQHKEMVVRWGTCRVNKPCPEPRAGVSRLVVGGSSGKLMGRLGSKYLCSAASCRWLCIFARGKEGKWHLPTPLLLEKLPTNTL